MSAVDQLADLERRLAAVEAQQADQLTPNAFFINAKGQVEERLTGTLTAAGINFQELSSAEPDDEIRWLDGAGTARESVAGYFTGGNHTLTLGTQGAVNAALDVVSHDTVPFSAFARVRAGALLKILLTDSGLSSFLQLAGASAQVAIAFGAGTITWAAALEGVSPPIAHGLTRVPKAVLATLSEAGPEPPIAVFTGTFTETTFIAGGRASKAATGTANFTWIAIG